MQTLQQKLTMFYKRIYVKIKAIKIYLKSRRKVLCFVIPIITIISGLVTIIGKGGIVDYIVIVKSKLSKRNSISTIILDPGHGGKDPGACTTYNIDGVDTIVNEKDITLHFANILKQKIKRAYPSIQIILTRSDDSYPSLEKRVSIANYFANKKNDGILFLSLHVNSSFSKNSSGYEIWYFSDESRRALIDRANQTKNKILSEIFNEKATATLGTQGEALAECINVALYNSIGTHTFDRGNKRDEWYVLRNSAVVSVLIEMGFISNENDVLLLLNDRYLDKFADGIITGIEYFDVYLKRQKKNNSHILN